MMTEIWIVLTPILIADAVNPVLFAFMVYAAGTKQPIANSTAALLGHTLAYISVGVILALGLERITHRLANPQYIDFVLEFFIGAFLLWFAFRPGNKENKQQKEDSGNLTPLKALYMGAIVNFVGIPFALPYFAALDQILKADLSVTQSLMLLVGYNVLYALPFAIIPVLVATFGERSRPLLQRANDLLERASHYLMPILLSLVGLALLADAIIYLISGEGLF